MARGRMIDKVVILSRKINAISEGAENLYYRLLVMTDDYGRYHAEPEIIKGTIYTRKKISLSAIRKRIDELWEIRLINLYDDDGERYLEIVKFENHQKFREDVKKKAECPEPGKFLQRSRDEAGTNRNEPERTGTKRPSKIREVNIIEDKLSKDIVLQIISHLNEKAKTNYSPKTKITTEYINGRIADGFKLDDFFYVIDVKCEDWIGDLEMEKFLRPKTLFATSNFEGYLNQKRERKGNYGVGGQGDNKKISALFEKQKREGDFDGLDDKEE